jgi:hypothetical protein
MTSPSVAYAILPSGGSEQNPLHPIFSCGGLCSPCCRGFRCTHRSELFPASQRDDYPPRSRTPDIADRGRDRCVPGRSGGLPHRTGCRRRGYSCLPPVIAHGGRHPFPEGHGTEIPRCVADPRSFWEWRTRRAGWSRSRGDVTGIYPSLSATPSRPFRRSRAPSRPVPRSHDRRNMRDGCGSGGDIRRTRRRCSVCCRSDPDGPAPVSAHFSRINAAGTAVFMSKLFGWSPLFLFRVPAFEADLFIFLPVVFVGFASGGMSVVYTSFYQMMARKFRRHQIRPPLSSLVLGMVGASVLGILVSPSLNGVSRPLFDALATGDLASLSIAAIPSVEWTIPILVIIIAGKMVGNVITTGSGMSAGFTGPAVHHGDGGEERSSRR